MTNVMKNRRSAEGKWFHLNGFYQITFLKVCHFASRSAKDNRVHRIQEWDTAVLVGLRFYGVEIVPFFIFW